MLKLSFTDNRTQVVMSLISVLTVLYFTCTTAFILDDSVADTITGIMLPVQIIGLHIFLPVGVILWSLIVQGYKKHVLVGIIMTVLFGINALQMILLPFFSLFFGGTIFGTCVLLFAMGERVYSVLHNSVKVLRQFSVAFVALFVSMVLATVTDAEHAFQNLPDYISVDSGGLSVHISLWWGTFMIVLIALSDMVKVDFIKNIDKQ